MTQNQDFNQQQLADLRHQLDQADYALLLALKKRFELVQQLGQLKKSMQLAAEQPQRWQVVVKNYQQWSEQLQINREFSEKLLELIRQEALRLQR